MPSSSWGPALKLQTSGTVRGTRGASRLADAPVWHGLGVHFLSCFFFPLPVFGQFGGGRGGRWRELETQPRVSWSPAPGNGNRLYSKNSPSPLTPVPSPGRDRQQTREALFLRLAGASAAEGRTDRGLGEPPGSGALETGVASPALSSLDACLEHPGWPCSPRSRPLPVWRHCRPAPRRLRSQHGSGVKPRGPGFARWFCREKATTSEGGRGLCCVVLCW